MYIYIYIYNTYIFNCIFLLKTSHFSGHCVSFINSSAVMTCEVFTTKIAVFESCNKQIFDKTILKKNIKWSAAIQAINCSLRIQVGVFFYVGILLKVLFAG